MEPNKPYDQAELAEALDKADRAYIDAMGMSLNTLTHPTKAGVLNVAVAAVTLPIFGFSHLLNNLVRVSVAVGRSKETIAELAKNHPHGPPPPETP
jgi:hypothetical protein